MVSAADTEALHNRPVTVSASSLVISKVELRDEMWKIKSPSFFRRASRIANDIFFNTLENFLCDTLAHVEMPSQIRN